MKLLLDTCVWDGAIKTLEAAGHDVVWTGHWPEDPGAEEINCLPWFDLSSTHRIAPESVAGIERNMHPFSKPIDVYRNILILDQPWKKETN